MNILSELTEILSITTVDGQKLPFAGAWLAPGFTNFGAAPVTYQTQSGYRQIGSRVLDYNLSDRRLTVLIRQGDQSITRDDYWIRRAEIINYFRPNRGGGNELILTINRPNNAGLRVKRSIRCRYESGLEFEDFDTDVNDFAVDAAISLIAHNPIWYDNEETILTPASGTDDNLVFPITFPIVFGESGLVFNTGDLAYTGSWRAYPKIIMTGPYATVRLENLGTGALIQMRVAIGASLTRTIELSESQFKIYDQSGNSKFSEMDQNSNLKDFYIPTVGEIIAGGSQAIKATLFGGTPSQSIFELRYNTAYYGI